MSNSLDAADQAKEIPVIAVSFKDNHPPTSFFDWIQQWRRKPSPASRPTSSIEAGLYEALGELQECPNCRRMLDISMHYRHQEYGCALAEQAFK